MCQAGTCVCRKLVVGIHGRSVITRVVVVGDEATMRNSQAASRTITRPSVDHVDPLDGECPEVGFHPVRHRSGRWPCLFAKKGAPTLVCSLDEAWSLLAE